MAKNYSSTFPSSHFMTGIRMAGCSSQFKFSWYQISPRYWFTNAIVPIHLPIFSGEKISSYCWSEFGGIYSWFSPINLLLNQKLLPLSSDDDLENDRLVQRILQRDVEGRGLPNDRVHRDDVLGLRALRVHQDRVPEILARLLVGKGDRACVLPREHRLNGQLVEVLLAWRLKLNGYLRGSLWRVFRLFYRGRTPPCKRLSFRRYFSGEFFKWRFFWPSSWL